MFVGYCMDNWDVVWYEPASDPDEEGGARLGLYRSPTGPPQTHEPMPEQVEWLPHFDPKRMESKGQKERTALHEQNLYEIWDLMGSRTLEEVEEKLAALIDGRPSHRKRSLLEVADRAVRDRLRKKQQGRSRKARKTGLEGQAVGGEDKASDSESEESGYGTDQEIQQFREDVRRCRDRARSRASSRTSMPPPARPASKTLAPRKGRRQATSPASVRGSSEDFIMSGGNGARPSTESVDGFEREPIGGSPSRASPRLSPEAGVRGLRSASAGDAKRSLVEDAELPSKKKKTPALGRSMIQNRAAGPLPTPATPGEQRDGGHGEGDDEEVLSDVDDQGFSDSHMRRAMRASMEPGGS